MARRRMSRLPIEYHDEPPPPAGPPGASGPARQFANPHRALSPPIPWPTPPIPINPAPIPPRPIFAVPPKSSAAFGWNCVRDACSGHASRGCSKAKSRTAHHTGPPVMLLRGQSAGKKGPSSGDSPVRNEPGSSSFGPAPVPGLPVTEGEFPLHQASSWNPPRNLRVPDDGEDSLC